MALFTLTINNLSPVLEKQNQEVQRIHSYLLLAAQDMRSAGGKKKTANILSDGAAVVGTWTYAPQAGS
jgi:hypothetical protein